MPVFRWFTWQSRSTASACSIWRDPRVFVPGHSLLVSMYAHIPHPAFIHQIMPNQSIHKKQSYLQVSHLLVWLLHTTAQVCKPNLFHEFDITFRVYSLKLLCVAHADSILWKLFYVAGCLFVAMQNMEEWEEAVFDKTKNMIEVKRFSLYNLVLTLWRKGQEKGQWCYISV